MGIKCLMYWRSLRSWTCLRCKNINVEYCWISASRSRKCCNTSIGLYQLSNGKAIVVIDTSRMPSGIFISLIASKTKPVAKYKKRNPWKKNFKLYSSLSIIFGKWAQMGTGRMCHSLSLIVINWICVLTVLNRFNNKIWALI